MVRFAARGCLLGLLCFSLQMMSACGGGSSSSGGGGGTTQVATPAITGTAALNGAQTVAMSDSTSGATIYYTLDGSTPTAKSTQYFAPILVASSVTVKAMATLSGDTDSAMASQTFGPNVASGTLVWSDEFNNTTGANTAPNSAVWTSDTGGGGWGNSELEIYCAPGSTTSPCDAANPNAYVGTDGYLHIVARQPSSGVYTSARLKTEGLFSISYGRIEARMQIPEGPGLWPAFWMLGNNITTVNWPACGEQDIMEHINAPQPDWVAGSLHGTNANLSQEYPGTTGPSFSGSDWHTYGMIWSPKSIEYYVDTPQNPYATFTPTSLTGQSGAVWPFDSGSGAFVILNLAVGGNWPGPPTAATTFPSEVLVDYVRVYTN
jgi:beta-glucanase (GH16 family)